MKALDTALLQRFLREAGKSLKGDWLLVGGTLLPAVGLQIRSTVDIDLVGLGSVEAAQTLEVMELAESLGLSVETINQAAAFFVKKAGAKKEDMLPLYKGKLATIYRPTVELYWKLKLERLSESDVLDCQHYFHFCKSNGDRIKMETLRALVKSKIKASEHAEKTHRLEQLLKIVSG